MYTVSGKFLPIGDLCVLVGENFQEHWLVVLRYYDECIGAEQDMNLAFAYLYNGLRRLNTYHDYVRLLNALYEYVCYFAGEHRERLNRVQLRYVQSLVVDIEECIERTT